MGEPEALFPFSSSFRSQLSGVLSRPPAVSRIDKIPDDKGVLETEIDAYSGVEFDQRDTTDRPKRPPTPPKPVSRTFSTCDQTNPISDNSSEATLSVPRYAEVNKPKNRPKVPPKPQIRSKVAVGTLPHSQKFAKEQKIISKEDYFFRVNSLPNLAPETNKPIRASDRFVMDDYQNQSTAGCGQLNKTEQFVVSNAYNTDQYRTTGTYLYSIDRQRTGYCNAVRGSRANVNDCAFAPNSDGPYENVYEDVNSKEIAPEDVTFKLTPEKEEGTDSDYTLMCSPMSEDHFTLGRKSVYENCAIIPSPNSDVFQLNEYENVRTPIPLGDPNIVGLPEEVGKRQILALSAEHASPTSSYDDHDSSVYSVQSSMPSTTASSFQRLQVCFFPPSPPSDFYLSNGTVVESPGSVTSGSSTRSRPSRSRIPVPIKSKSTDPSTTPTSTSSDQRLPVPATPTSSNARSKTITINTKKVELPTPPPHSNELTTNGKSLTSSGKGAKWYEKLGCIQTDTIVPSEPYGRPGERKRSKSLNKEQTRKSQFFLPVDPKDTNPPNVQQQYETNLQ